MVMNFILEKLCNLDEQVICGYTVSTEVKKVWNAELNILKKLLEICDKYQLKVSLGYGSLLGAVRHKGFIPWDDDIDVIMPREDYEKFIQVCSSELSYPFYLENYKNDKSLCYGSSMIKLENTTFILKMNASLYLKHKWNIFIDISPLDYFDDSDKELCNSVLLQYDILRYINYRHNKRLMLCGYKFYKDIKHRLGELARLDNDSLYAKYESLVQSIPHNLKYFADITMFKSPYSMPLYKADIFSKLVYMDFEYLSVPVVSDYHEVLTSMYGDYRTPVQYPSEHGSTDDVIKDANISYKKKVRKYQSFFYFVCLLSNSIYSNVFIKSDFYYYYNSFLLSYKLFCNKDKKIIFWGKSEFLSRYINSHNLKHKRIIGIVDKNHHKENSFFCGYKVYSLTDLKMLSPELIIVTITNDKKSRYFEIKDYMLKSNYNYKISFL